MGNIKRPKIGDRIEFEGKVGIVDYLYPNNDLGFAFKQENGQKMVVGSSAVRAGNFKILEKNMDNLVVGDVLIDSVSERTLLGVINDNLFVLSEWGSPTIADTFYTLEEIKKRFTLKGTEEFTEVTLEEVAEKMGVDVSKLRIKD